MDGPNPSEMDIKVFIPAPTSYSANAIHFLVWETYDRNHEKSREVSNYRRKKMTVNLIIHHMSCNFYHKPVP